MMDDESKATYFDTVHSNIAEYGYHLTYVSASDDNKIGYEPSFCYSTGIHHTYGIPEVFISSLPSGLCANLVMHYVERFNATKDIAINERCDLLDDWFAVYLCPIANHRLKTYALTTFKLFDERIISYVQLVFPDANGYYPCDTSYEYDQVLLTDYFQ